MLRTRSHLLHPAPQRSATPPATPTAVPGTSLSSTHSLFRLVLSLSLAHPRAPRHRPIARAHEHVPLTLSCPPSAASLTHLRAILSTQMLSSCHHGLAHLRAPCHAPCFARPSLSPTLVLSRAPLRTLQASVPLAELRRLAHRAPPLRHLTHAPVLLRLAHLVDPATSVASYPSSCTPATPPLHAIPIAKLCSLPPCHLCCPCMHLFPSHHFIHHRLAHHHAISRTLTLKSCTPPSYCLTHLTTISITSQ